jgi:hypothetical protein
VTLLARGVTPIPSSTAKQRKEESRTGLRSGLALQHVWLTPSSMDSPWKRGDKADALVGSVLKRTEMAESDRRSMLRRKT